MAVWRAMIHKYRKISWLLVCAVLSLTLFPAHLHLHHDQDLHSNSSTHEHVLDVHMATAQLDEEHHEDATVIDTVANVLVKKLQDNPLTPYILFIFIWAFTTTRQVRSYLRLKIVHFFAHFQAFTPPLRAPPLL